MYLHGFVPSCRRPFAEGRVSVGDHSCPLDFGPPQADEFFRPLDNKKGFPHPDLNFFTTSPPVPGQWKDIHGPRVKGGKNPFSLDKSLENDIKKMNFFQ